MKDELEKLKQELTLARANRDIAIQKAQSANEEASRLTLLIYKLESQILTILDQKPVD